MTPLTRLADKKLLSQSQPYRLLHEPIRGAVFLVVLYKTEFYNPESKRPMNMNPYVHTDSKVIKHILSVHTNTST